ncbi:MAG: hypothetical protein K0S70_244 [Microbacterium sp.]|jgi:hypothetical protein|nr:hypothetical protein [Microbacterium sp.]
MVIAYAQSDDRQGLNAAIDGETVDSNDASFAVVRAQAITLNLTRRSVAVGAVEVRHGGGVVRLEITGDDDPDGTRSQIAVVAAIEELATSPADTVRRALESVRAIGRVASPEKLRTGFASGLDADRSRRRTLNLVAAGVSTLIVVTVIWIWTR